MDEVLDELYTERRKADDSAAEEIIRRLEERKNYIPDSDRIRRDYSYVLLKEYRNYIKGKEEKNK